MANTKYRIRKRDAHNWVIERYIAEHSGRGKKSDKPFEPHWDPNPLGHYPTAKAALAAYADKGLGELLGDRCVSEIEGRVDKIIQRLQDILVVEQA